MKDSEDQKGEVREWEKSLLGERGPPNEGELREPGTVSLTDEVGVEDKKGKNNQKGIKEKSMLVFSISVCIYWFLV